MAEVRISAEPRTEFGKGGARRTRRAGKVPAVVYGHGRAPAHISLPGHDLMLALKTANVLLTVPVDGDELLVLPKSVQRHAIKGDLEHVDLVVVRRGEKVTVEIAVTLTGDAVPETMVDQQLTTLTIEAEATHIPSGVEVSIDGLGAGDHVVAGSVSLPIGVTLVNDAEQVVVQGLVAPSVEALEAELAEAEAEAGIERDATDEEVAADAEAGAESSDSDSADGGRGGDAPAEES